MPPHILLVLPAYRESRRLPPFLKSLCHAIRDASLTTVSVRVVDDGSGARERQVVSDVCAELRSEFPFLQEPRLLERNRGKGGAIYAGWETAEDGQTWLAFVDSDGAVSAQETVRFLKLVEKADAASECVFAVRVADDGTNVRRTLLRGLMGNVFRLLVRVIHRLPVPDTQCGLKAVPTTLFRRVRPFLTESRFCFDIDLARNLKVLGTAFRIVPISWEESPGSKVSFAATLRMFFAVFRLRFQKSAAPTDAE